MRLKRDMYKIETEKHKKLREKLRADGMSFNEFIDRITSMYLDGKFELKD